MNPDDFPAPKDGFVLTHFLVVADQVRSRDFYQKIFGGQVLIERDPVIMKVANSWLILNDGWHLAIRKDLPDGACTRAPKYVQPFTDRETWSRKFYSCGRFRRITLGLTSGLGTLNDSIG